MLRPAARWPRLARSMPVAKAMAMGTAQCRARGSLPAAGREQRVVRVPRSVELARERQSREARIRHCLMPGSIAAHGRAGKVAVEETVACHGGSRNERAPDRMALPVPRWIARLSSVHRRHDPGVALVAGLSGLLFTAARHCGRKRSRNFEQIETVRKGPSFVEERLHGGRLARTDYHGFLCLTGFIQILIPYGIGIQS